MTPITIIANVGFSGSQSSKPGQATNTAKLVPIVGSNPAVFTPGAATPPIDLQNLLDTVLAQFKAGQQVQIVFSDVPAPVAAPAPAATS